MSRIKLKVGHFQSPLLTVSSLENMARLATYLKNLQTIRQRFEQMSGEIFYLGCPTATDTKRNILLEFTLAVGIGPAFKHCLQHAGSRIWEVFLAHAVLCKALWNKSGGFP